MVRVVIMNEKKKTQFDVDMANINETFPFKLVNVIIHPDSMKKYAN